VIKKGKEIFESKKYPTKFYVLDENTQAAIWISVVPKNGFPSNMVFDMNNDEKFDFIDLQNGLSFEVSKINFISKY
jgi:hypothetical protein